LGQVLLLFAAKAGVAAIDSVSAQEQTAINIFFIFSSLSFYWILPASAGLSNIIALFIFAGIA